LVFRVIISDNHNTFLKLEACKQREDIKLGK
jgi:hypothetical protein